VTRALRTHRLVLSTIVLVLAMGGLGTLLLASSSGATSASAAGPRVLGPGRVTVRIVVDHSHFEMKPIRVAEHTEVRFVVVNRDPIGHELIVGGPDVQARHEGGHEASHPPVSGEVSVPALQTASTSYVFHGIGPVEYACHLPGHYRYGMHGVIDVVAAPARPTAVTS
jgi:uncharacterized cupredoxin-like copper-binding protein